MTTIKDEDFLVDRLEPKILTLAKLDAGGGGAVFCWSDPYMRSMSVELDTVDFLRLGSPGYIRISIEAVDARSAIVAAREGAAR